MEVWIMEKQLLRDLELKESPQCECKKAFISSFCRLKVLPSVCTLQKGFYFPTALYKHQEILFKKSVTLLA